jgi:transcriptional regulator NrdR family protein
VKCGVYTSKCKHSSGCVCFLIAWIAALIKKDGSKVLFERGKLLSGVAKACHKRPVDPEEIVNEIEGELQNSLRNEISTNELGEIVMQKLKECLTKNIG